MQHLIHSTKITLNIAFAAALIVAGVSAVSVQTAQATGSYVSSVDYSYSSGGGDNNSNNNSSNSSYVSSVDYTYSSGNSTSNDGGNYSGSCCTQASTPSYVDSIDYTYSTPSYSSTPSYVDSIDYTYPSYTTTSYTPSYGCTWGCGGSYIYTPPTYVQPTCAVTANKTTIYAGDTVTIGWSSTNANYGNISNLGSNVPTSGSRQITLNNTTTFSGSFYGNGGTATCSATVYVNPKPAPTCSITGPDTATPGQTITLNWSSTNATRGDIQNLGTNLPTSGSHSFIIGNTTTFTGTFYGVNGQTANCVKTVTVTNYCPAGYTGTYPNCYPPQNNNLSCTISVNNYQSGYNNYFPRGTAVTLSWNSNGATYGSINNGFGTVNPSGSRTIYPTQTTTYTGTFWNSNGQQVTCSATVYVQSYVPPQNPNTPFVTLSQVPYTGLDLGPVGTVIYWGFLAFWCALAAYLIVVKKVQNSVYASLKGILFGSGASHATHAQASHTPHASHVSYAAPAEVDATDSFIVSQINRSRN
jgi:hypothetical protein